MATELEEMDGVEGDRLLELCWMIDVYSPNV